MLENRSAIAEAVESALLSLGVGGIGAAVGIAIFASRSRAAICGASQAPVGCSAVLVGRAHHFASVAAKAAIAALIAGAVIMVARDLREGEA